MSNRDERIHKALEDLRERCAWVAERITRRRRMISALMNNEAVKPCEVAATIRKIDVQQHYECVVREIEALLAERDALREVLEVLGRAHQTAMEQTLKARIPECGEFAGIAQDLDFVVATLRERLGEKV